MSIHCFRPRRTGVLGMAFVLSALASATASAQFVEPDTSKARFRFGPVMLNPVVELKNFGIDTNVFNESLDRARRDFTFTVSPQTELWMRVGRTWMTGNVREDLLWYQTYASERAGNTAYTLGWLVPLNRINASLATSFLSARDRPGFEIDARVRRKELTFKGAAEVRVLANTFVGVRGSQEHIDFDSAESFLGSNLRQELNRSVSAGAMTLRHQLTPLTSISVDAGRTEDRFEFSSQRDATSTTAGVEIVFDPFAVIKGTARFGYRDYQPAAPDVPRYRGTTAAVDLAYVLLGTTRFSVQVVRDISYSYDNAQPYYLQSGIQTIVAQQIFGPVDMVGRFGYQTLAYQDRVTTVSRLIDRRDVVHSYGGGVGYHLGDTTRVGIDVDKQRRQSDLVHRRYEGLRVGASVTYGF